MTTPITLHTCPAETLYSGPFWTLLEQVTKKTPENTLVIVSSYKLKEAIEKKITEAHPENTLMPSCLTLDELIQNHRGIPLEETPTVDQILFENTLKKHKSISQKKLTKGFKNRLRDTLLKSFTYNFNIHKLSSHYWGSTINSLKKTFEDLCQSHKITRKPKAYEIVSKSKAFENTLQTKGCFIIGFWQCPEYQWPTLQTILTKSDTSNILIPYVEHDPHYKGIQPLFQRLTTLPNVTHFHQISQKSSPKPRWIISENIDKECEWICQDIRQKKENNPDIKWEDFTLICPSPTQYAPIIYPLLTSYNIPSKTPFKQPLYQHPLYRGINALLDWIETPTYPQFIQVLFTPILTTITHNNKEYTGEPSFFQKIVENYGKKNTLESLKDLCFLHIDRLKKNPTSSSKSIEEISQEIQQSQNQINILEHFIEIQNNYKNIKSPDLFLDELQKTLQKWNIESPIHETLFNHAYTISQQYHLLTPNYTLKNFNKYLKQELSSKEISITPEDKTGIHIITKFDSFCYPLQQSYILNCTAGTWPKTATDNLFFSESELEKLDWPNQKIYRDWDELLFFICIRQSQSITLTMPKSLNGSPTIPSPFVNKLKHDYLGVLNPEIATLSTTECPHKTYLQILGNATQKNKDLLTDQSPHKPEWKALHSQLKTPFSYNFSLEKNSTLQKDCKHHIQNTEFSPTQLESYQKCPTAYYFKHFLKEQPIKPSQEDIPQEIWGQFVHKILQKIGETMKENNLSFHTSKNHEEIQNLAFNITKKELEQQTQNQFLWTQKEKKLLGTPQKLGLISAWIHCEINDVNPLIPQQFEETLSTEFQHPKLGAIKLKGTIDVIAEDPSGQWIAIQDYKTGKSTPTTTDIKTFYHLQMPIYQWLVQKKNPQKTLAGSFIIKLNATQEVEKKCLTTTDLEKKNFLKLGRKRPAILDDDFNTQLEKHLKHLIELIYNAHFNYIPPKPLDTYQDKRKQVCQFCTYWSTCHYPKRFQK